MFGRLYPTDNGHTRLQLLETFSIKTTSKDTRLSLVNHVLKPNKLEMSLEHLHHNPFIPDEMHLPVKDEILLTVNPDILLTLEAIIFFQAHQLQSPAKLVDFFPVKHLLQSSYRCYCVCECLQIFIQYDKRAN